MNQFIRQIHRQYLFNRGPRNITTVLYILLLVSLRFARDASPREVGLPSPARTVRLVRGARQPNARRLAPLRPCLKRWLAAPVGSAPVGQLEPIVVPFAVPTGADPHIVQGAPRQAPPSQTHVRGLCGVRSVRDCAG